MEENLKIYLKIYYIYELVLFLHAAKSPQVLLLPNMISHTGLLLLYIKKGSKEIEKEDYFGGIKSTIFARISPNASTPRRFASSL